MSMKAVWRRTGTGPLTRRIVPLTVVEQREHDAVHPPEEVTKLRLVRALRSAGHLAAVQQHMNGAPPSAVKEDWAVASAIARQDEIIVELVAVLGITEEDMDALFVLAE